MSFLVLEGVSKTLYSQAPCAVLREISFQLRPGERAGLWGATGAGKTTLLRLIAGLEKVDAGRIWIDEALVSSNKEHLPPSRRRVGMVFQNLGLWPHLHVAGHLEFVLSASGLSSRERRERSEEILNAFLLRDLAGRFPAELSGGERHLLALARALAGEIRLLLLDEPFNGLDGFLKDRVIQALDQAVTARKLTMLLVSHDPAERRRLCSRGIHLGEGRVWEGEGQPFRAPEPGRNGMEDLRP